MKLWFLAVGLTTVLASAGMAAPLPQAGSAAPTTQAPAPPPPKVHVGQPMPEFTLPYLEPAPDGGRPRTKTVKLSDFKGRQVVVLAFFPAAFSPG